MFIGHTKEVSFLSRIIRDGHADHAYIFSGPEKIGKFFLAKIFARSIIEGGEEIKLDINASNIFLPDLLILEPPIETVKGVTKEKIISVKKIREIENDLSLYPYSGKFKVLIINNAHKMNVQAQNALLKTLEEPNSQTIIILITHEIEVILPTILSRCQLLRFGLIGSQEIKLNMQIKASNKEIFEKVSLLGRPGLVYDVLSNEDIRVEYEEAIRTLQNFYKMRIGERMELADRMSKNVAKSIRDLELWSWLIHEKALNNLRIFKVISKINNTLKQIKNTNVNIKLTLENLFIDL